jgi:hypothetical protein
MKDLIIHPMDEGKKGALLPVSGPVTVDTFGGRVHVEWNAQAAVTPLGQLPFFTEYLRASEPLPGAVTRGAPPLTCKQRFFLAPCPGMMAECRGVCAYSAAGRGVALSVGISP